MDVVPLSLYFDIERENKADLAVIARAALAFTDAIEDAAYVIDPSLILRIELVDSKKGSLWINSSLKGIKSKDGIQKITLRALVMAAISWFTRDRHAISKPDVIEYLARSEIDGKYTDIQIDELLQKVNYIFDRQLAASNVERFYREIEIDPKILGVGASKSSSKKPAGIVPRSEFRARSGLSSDITQTYNRRSRRSIQRVTIIGPILLHASRSWRFSNAESEFTAMIKDRTFLDDLLSGRISIPMVEDVELDVDLETEEENRDGVWVVTKRTVHQVVGTIQPMIQNNLDFL